MSLNAFLALIVFAFVTSITPGPNNLMLLASGVNFGFVRTVPHMFGIAGGFATLLFGVGLGLGAVLKAYPALDLALKFAGGGSLRSARLIAGLELLAAAFVAVLGAALFTGLWIGGMGS